MGSDFIFFVALAFASILLILVKPLAKQLTCTLSIYNALEKRLYFNAILRFLIEGYLEFAICAFVNLYYIEWGNIAENFITVFAFLLVAISIILPILSGILLTKL